MAVRRKVALALIGALWLAAPGTSAQHGLEYEVKAGFLYNIINFVTWPPDAFVGATDPVRVCIVGPDPFGRLLDRAIEGGTANRRPIVANRIADPNDIAACHLVFLPGGNTDRIDRAVRAASQRPVLTVGEAPDFLRRGGMIAFVVDGGRVRFDINLPAATSRGLMLSSRLLQVARTVVGKGQTG
jgi:uncharacterized protein DUF4154